MRRGGIIFNVNLLTFTFTYNIFSKHFKVLNVQILNVKTFYSVICRGLFFSYLVFIQTNTFYLGKNVCAI